MTLSPFSMFRLTVTHPSRNVLRPDYLPNPPGTGHVPPGVPYWYRTELVRAEHTGKGIRRRLEGRYVAGHLKADLARIAQVSRSLANLRDEFANLTKITDVGAAAGDPGLASALRDFAADWSDKRTALTGQMHELSQLAAEAVRAYTGTDVTLAQALSGAGPGRPAAGPGGISR
jgi:hypothetical protein